MPRPRPLRPRFAATALALWLAGCTADTVFTPADADRVTNGMTREQVTEIMGGPPSRVADGGRTLVWSWSHPNAMQTNGFYAEFHLGPDGRTVGVPPNGIFGKRNHPDPLLDPETGQPVR